VVDYPVSSNIIFPKKHVLISSQTRVYSKTRTFYGCYIIKCLMCLHGINYFIIKYMTQQSSGNTKNPMGKPSGTQGGDGLKDVNIDQKTEQEITDRYLNEDQEVSDNTKVAHPNRNVSKNEDN
jgi:hypothetical protein